MDYYRQGLERQRAGDAEAALTYLTWAVELDPSLVEAYAARSAVHLGRGDPVEALDDADVALEIAPSARAYLVRGEALLMMGQYQQALTAYDEALERDPSLKRETFRSRWLAARGAGNDDRLAALSEEYAGAYSNDPLRHYYQAWVALESGLSREAIPVLVAGIVESADPPAVLWWLLGQAYSEIEAWPEAVTALETARALIEAGDSTLGFHTDEPVAALFSALGRAYLGAGRCADAESMLTYAISIGASTVENGALLRNAQICQTPTPVTTPSPTETPSAG